MKNTALLIIDFQNDYFPGGNRPLHEPELAIKQGAKLLSAFRENGFPVFHVRHESLTDKAEVFVPGSAGAEIHSAVSPSLEEAVVVKHKVNSFLDTNLKQLLDEHQIEQLVIVGAMSHMCIDGGTRAASDLGYICHLVHDACTTLELEFNGVTVPALQVHAAFMAALQAYSSVTSTDDLLGRLGK